MKELPGLALELYTRADTSSLLKARAAYALGKFDKQRRELSLAGAAEDVPACADRRSAWCRIVARVPLKDTGLPVNRRRSSFVTMKRCRISVKRRS